MKANFTMRMAAGCSILVAVCQTAAMAGGFGGGSSGMHSVSSGNHTSFQTSSNLSSFKATSNFKTPSNIKVTTPNTLLKVTNNNTKFVTGNGLSKTTGLQSVNLKSKGINNVVQTPSKNIFKPVPFCAPGKCLPGQNWCSNWLWYNPWFYGNCGYGYFGYCDPYLYGYPCGYGYSSCTTPIVLTIANTTTPVAVQQAASKLTLQLGQSYTIANEKFGDKAGELSLQVSGLTLPVRIDKWDAQQINFTVPFVGLDKPTDGLFQIAGADHSVSKAVPVTVIVGQELTQATK
jgi:hypothetical protein